MPNSSSGSSFGHLRKSRSVSSRHSKSRSYARGSSKKEPSSLASEPAAENLELAEHLDEPNIDESANSESEASDHGVKSFAEGIRNEGNCSEAGEKHETIIPVPESLQPFLDDSQSDSESLREGIDEAVPIKTSEHDQNELIDRSLDTKALVPASTALLAPTPISAPNTYVDHRDNESLSSSVSSFTETSHRGGETYRPRSYQAPQYYRHAEGPPYWYSTVGPSPVVSRAIPVMQNTAAMSFPPSPSVPPSFPISTATPTRSASPYGRSASRSSSTSRGSSDRPRETPLHHHAPFNPIPHPPYPPLPPVIEGVPLLARFQATMANVANLSAALPDMQALMFEHQHMHRELDRREEALRKAELHQQETLKQKEHHVNMLSKELDDAKTRSSAEANKYRLEMGNLEEKYRELVESNKKIEQLLEDSRTGFEEWRAKQLAESKIREVKLKEALQAKLRSMQNGFDEQKEQHLHRSEVEKKRFITQHEEDIAAKQREHKGLIEELRQTWDSERDLLVTELRAEFESERHDVEFANEASRAKMIASHQQEIERLRKEHAGSTIAEASRHKIDIDRQTFMVEQERAQSREELILLKENLKLLENENRRLQAMDSTQLEVSDIRHKPEAFYVDALKSLRQQIINLAEDEFKEYVNADKSIERWPLPLTEKLPNFLDNTDASRAIRLAYVRYVVSQTICSRVFQPFLFLLGKRNDKADAFLMKISSELKLQSAKKEFAWRQQTLHTAYTSPDAKKATNMAGGAVVDEIVNTLRPLFQESQTSSVVAAVKRIVKLAGETWRYARLEEQIFVAYMPTEEEAREKYQNLTNTLESSSQTSSAVLIGTIPCILKELVQNANDLIHRPRPCQVLLEGEYLKSDDPSVVKRFDELGIRNTPQTNDESLHSQANIIIDPNDYKSSPQAALETAPANVSGTNHTKTAKESKIADMPESHQPQTSSLFTASPDDKPNIENDQAANAQRRYSSTFSDVNMRRLQSDLGGRPISMFADSLPHRMPSPYNDRMTRGRSGQGMHDTWRQAQWDE